MKKINKTRMLAAALAALLGAPAFAQQPAPRPGSKAQASDQSGYAWRGSDQSGYAWRGHGRGHDAPYLAFGAAEPSQDFTGRDRDTALRECADMSRKYAESTWGAMQMQQWRTCMMAHGQPE